MRSDSNYQKKEMEKLFNNRSETFCALFVTKEAKVFKSQILQLPADTSTGNAVLRDLSIGFTMVPTRRNFAGACKVVQSENSIYRQMIQDTERAAPEEITTRWADPTVDHLAIIYEHMTEFDGGWKRLKEYIMNSADDNLPPIWLRLQKASVPAGTPIQARTVEVSVGSDRELLGTTLDNSLILIPLKTMLREENGRTEEEWSCGSLISGREVKSISTMRVWDIESIWVGSPT